VKRIEVPNRDRERRIVAAIELVLLVALLGALAIANVKMFLMLQRVGLPWTRGLPVTGLFLGAGYLALRRIRTLTPRLRRGSDDG
jgi:hypothetical protein